MNNIAILYSEKTPLLDAISSQLESFNVSLFQELPSNIDEYDLVIGIGNKFRNKYKGLACHHSLLPAFNSENPVYDAFMQGVKVTGITVYYNEPFKILAQYPLMISNSAHFDEIQTQLSYLEQVIYPIVTLKYAKNEVIEISEIFKKHSCNGSCTSCSGCK